MSTTENRPAPSGGRSPGISYQELLATDTRAVPVALRTEHAGAFGLDDVPADVYFSPEYHRREIEKIWLEVWQFACREEHIPNVGDTEVYEIGRYSAIVVRTGPDEIKAFPNACLHRGRRLRDRAGTVGELQCPFHGFTWNLDGTLKFTPTAWDFPHVDADNFALTSLPVGRWGGFVFINFDTAPGQTFDEFIADVASHFDQWRLQDRYVEAHVAKIAPCNWKLAQEAFMEGFHLVTTHPQSITGVGDANSQYDAIGNMARGITPVGIPSPHLTWTPSEQEMMNSLLDIGLDEADLAVVPEGKTARETLAAGVRERLRPTIGDDRADAASDAELVDNIYYTVFPNWHPWAGFNRIVYRARPYGDNPEMSIFECLYLSPFTGDRPPPAKVHWLGPDESILEATELGNLARVFDQDMFNLPSVQNGLHTLNRYRPGVRLSAYSETKLRHFFHFYWQHLEQD